eukprot:15136182-Alexandrium_andersonii.AAC.1
MSLAPGRAWVVQALPGAKLMAVRRVKQVPMWTAEKLTRWFGTIGWTEVEAVAPPQGPNAGW